jgi:hypothetical protein
MPHKFYGTWSVVVESSNADYGQRFQIADSDRDGTYGGVVGSVIGVSGQEWTVTMEWNDGTGWKPSDVRKSAGFTLLGGLAIRLHADDGTAPAQDRDYNDLVLFCTNLDPETNPIPSENPAPDWSLYDFTIRRDMLRRPHE